MTDNTSNSATPDTIVLIHGFWMTPRSWEKWVESYEGRGYSERDGFLRTGTSGATKYARAATMLTI